MNHRDVFVSYAHIQADWVHDNLVSILRASGISISTYIANMSTLIRYLEANP